MELGHFLWFALGEFISLDGDGEDEPHSRDSMVINHRTFHSSGVLVQDWGMDMLQHAILKD